MGRTKKLRIILFILILMLIGLIFYKNYGSNPEFIEKILNIIQDKNVKIPTTSENSVNYEFKTVKITDNFSPNSYEDIKNIYYTVLNNRWNNFTFYCTEEYTNCASDVTNFANGDKNLDLLNNYVSPYNSYEKFDTSIKNGDTITLSITYLYSDEEIIIIKNKIEEIINTLGIDKNNISITTIKLIHKYLIDNITYDDKYNKEDTSSLSNKAYGALTTGKAVCSGYADTFALILNELNIPNFKVSSEEHIWNIIYFENKWSHIDVTWDDDEKYQNNIYNFFMIDTEKLLNNDSTKHTFDKSLYLELQ